MEDDPSVPLPKIRPPRVLGVVIEDDLTVPLPKIGPPRVLGVGVQDDPTVPQPKIKISINGPPRYWP